MTLSVRQRVEGVAAGLVALVLRAMPRRVALRLGASLGYLVGRCDQRHVEIAVENLRHAFPDWGESRRRRVAHGVYAHFGRILFDILWLSTRSPQRMLSFVDFEGIEHYRAAKERGRGILFITAHFGNWEVHAVSHSIIHDPLGVVARPLDNPHLDARLCAFRRLGGNTVIYKRHALAQMLRLIRAGSAVAILIDQNVQAKDGIFVDFFGRAAATTKVAAALVLKTECTVLPCRAVLRDDGRYRLVYGPPMRWTATEDRRADISRITQDLTHRIERWIRETPEQWLWIHRRWRTRPPDEIQRCDMGREGDK
jgi:KDO2-lipid IV(A) lauroyltransferase